MNNDSQFTTIGDEPVEARIVAWVLGEASAFEAAELERLCEERPELMIFKRRMLALHGLLAEAENPQADESWKLPAEKRRNLEFVLWKKNVADIGNAREKRVKRSGRRALLAIAACLMLTVVVAGLLAPAGMRQRKKSDVVADARSMAIQRELAALEDLEMGDRRQPLRTDLPPELIEGTPRPIVLPEQTPSSRSVVVHDETHMMERMVRRDSNQKPTAPSSSMAKVLTAGTAGGTAVPVPVPDVDVTAPSLDFGDSSDFGTGWGEGKNQEDGRLAGGVDIVDGTKLEAQLGLRSGDQAVSLNNIDAFSNRPELPAEGEAAAENKMATGDMPVLGRLFEDKENALPLAAGGIVTEEVRYKIDDSDKRPAPSGEPNTAADDTGNDYWDTLEAVAKGKATGTEHEIQTEYEENNSQLLAEVAQLKKRLEEPAISDSNKQALFTEYRKKNQLLVDARREFEKDQELLQQMKLKVMASSIKVMPEPPKPDLTELMEEIAASEEPYSTFSLNISDASFRIAQAAMDKGERPDPAGVKVEQFYNAVDYGDPAPAAGEPVSCEIEQAAHPVIPGRNLVRVALKTAAAGRSAAQPLRLTLLVDQSGSMTRADRRAAMDTAMASLGKLLTEKDLVNIVGFSRTSRLVADGMKGDEAGKKLAELVNQSASEGGTNLETAIDLAAQMAQRRMLAGAQNRIVLFTDGAANLGDADPQRLAAKVGQLRQQGVAFDIAGIAADGLNDELLGELARKGNGRYYVVGKGAEEDFAKQLAGAFRPAAENVKVQVRFNPERVTSYKLIGFEKDRLKTEDFRNDAVDAAELAAEEAGVAIYQIEPNPNGSGEIGEVSVRFRDTASGEMVERGWTIPHDAAAPAIDRTTPSMQLALLSMFAAEKLKGGPLGEAIDFRQLAEAQANVKHFFGNDARVVEMLRMVEMLK